MKVYTDVQGSNAWIEARRGCITASRFKDARSKTAKGAPTAKAMLYALDTARERCGGRADSKAVTFAMKMGSVEEAPARMAYEAETGAYVKEAGFITTDDRVYGGSVDGFVGDDGIVEIKTMVSSATFFAAVVDEDHSEYMDQVQGLMWLLDRKWTDLVLWAPDMEAVGLGLTIRRIKRDEAYIEKMSQDLVSFSCLVREYENQVRFKMAARETQPA